MGEQNDRTPREPEGESSGNTGSEVQNGNRSTTDVTHDSERAGSPSAVAGETRDGALCGGQCSEETQHAEETELAEESEPLLQTNSSVEKQQLAAVMEIARIINSRLELEYILSAISSELSKVIDYDIGCVAIYERDENCLFIRHISRRSGDRSGEGRYVPLEETNLIGWVAINRKPILRNNIPKDARFAEIMKEDNLKSDIVVPLIARDTLIGTLNIGSYEYNHYTEFDLELVAKFARLTSLAVENSQLLGKLRDLGSKYRHLMNNASEVIVLMKSSCEILECSAATYKLSGYSPEEIIGKEFFLFTTPDRRDVARKIFYKVLRGEPHRNMEIPYLKKNGEVVYLDVYATLVKIKRNPYILAIAHDVTERKLLQEKITIQNRELREINKKLMALDELKSDFLGRISHEFRTPLSIIMAYTGTLLDDREQAIDRDTANEFLQVITTQSNKLLNLINDLLDLSKVEISETMLDISAGGINEIIRISASIVGPFARQNNVEVETRLDADVPIINFDPLRIQQVCVNLLNNAIKYSGAGGKVAISSNKGKDEIIVSVCDSGPGIDQEDIPGIFENFSQIDGGTARACNGLGIGLRLVKHYVELHRGRIWVESERGKGSTFSFSLPIVMISDGLVPFDWQGS